MKVEPYNAIGRDLLKKRAELVKSNAKFAEDVCKILRENADEKAETVSQVDLEPEEQIYKGFTPNRDKFLFPKWHAAPWDEKFKMLDKFEDERMKIFGEQVIFNEAPDVLPEPVYKKIKKKIADRILSMGNEKWWTIPKLQKEIDDLREKDDMMFAFKSKDEKLKFLDQIDQYGNFLEEKYSKI